MRILVAERGGEGQALHVQKPSFDQALQTQKGPPYERDIEVLCAPMKEKDRLRQIMRVNACRMIDAHDPCAVRIVENPS